MTGQTAYATEISEGTTTVVNQGECGANLTWTFDEKGVLTISGTGAMADYAKPDPSMEPQLLSGEDEEVSEDSDNPYASINKAPWAEYYQDITQVVIEDGVTSVGNWSFCNCKNIKSVVFEGESDVTIIGNGAFYACWYLAEIDIPESVTEIGESVFVATDIGKIELSDNVKSIGAEAFANCYLLEEVTLPAKLTVMNESLFDGCESLKEIKIPETVTSIGDYVFYGCSSLTQITIPNSVTELGQQSFKNCSSLEQIVIPENISILEPGLLENCSSLKNVRILGKVKTIDSYVFYKCSSLTQITIPETVESIGAYAFANSGLIEVKIPKSVDSLGKYAFYKCSSLSKLNLQGKLTSCGSSVFGDCKYLSEVTIADGVTVIGDKMFYYCNGLQNITIPDTVTTIGDYAFGYCTRLGNGEDINPSKVQYTWDEIDKSTGLTNVTLSKNLTSIGEGAFTHCFKMSAIDLPDTLKSIGKQAFANCYVLKEIVLPDKVSSIYDSTFLGCEKLRKITFSDQMKLIEKNAFSGCTAMEKVYYGGTNAEWEEIDITEEGNEEFLDALIYCSDGPLGLLTNKKTEQEIEGEFGAKSITIESINGYIRGSTELPLNAAETGIIFTLDENWEKEHGDLLIDKEDGMKAVEGILYLWDAEGNRREYWAMPDYYPGGDIRVTLWNINASKEPFLPNQELCMELIDLDGNVLARKYCKTVSFQRFTFDNFIAPVSDEIIFDVFGKAKGKVLLQEEKNSKFEIGDEGVCFGMALGVSLVNAGAIDATAFDECIVLDQAERYTKMTDILGVKDAEEFIMMCHIMQYKDSVQRALDDSLTIGGNGISGENGLMDAIDMYKNGKCAMPLIYYMSSSGGKVEHTLPAYDYEVDEEGVLNIQVYECNYAQYIPGIIKVTDYQGEAPSWKYITVSDNCDGKYGSLRWFVPVSDCLTDNSVYFKSLLYMKNDIFASYIGVEKQTIEWIANENISNGNETEDDSSMTWLWGDGTVKIEKPESDISIADDYALYTIKAADTVEFTLDNGNVSKAVLTGEEEVQASCEYSTESGDVVVEVKGTTDEAVQIEYKDATVEISGLKEGTITVTYEDGRVWTKEIVENMENVIVNADGTNAPTDENGVIWGESLEEDPKEDESGDSEEEANVDGAGNLGKDANNDNASMEESVDTGDRSPIIACLMVMLFSLISIVIILRYAFMRRTD